MTVNEKMTELADAIRNKTGNNKPLTLDGMIEEVNNITIGDNYYDTFWDGYQDAKNGISQVYSGNYLFSGPGWNDITFYPKYNMPYMSNCGNMFAASNITDIKGRLEELGIKLDFGKCSNMNNLFYYAKTTRVPEINAIKASAFGNFCGQATKLISVDKVILKADGSQTWSNSFNKCAALESITFSGQNETEETGPTGFIGQNGLDFSYSHKLNKESLINIVNHLLPTASSKIVTLSLTAVNNAFETETGLADGSTSAEWNTLKASKSNWTISLIDNT
jgi:hypothetical protein